MSDLVKQALDSLIPGGVRRGEMRQGSRVLRWVEAGSGAPAVVLDAALGEPGSLAWAGVMPLVAPRTRVIAYDRAGIGASDPVPALTLDVQVGDFAAVAKAAGQGPCVLVGHSWGGMLAQLAARTHPDLTAGLVLVDPADETSWAALPAEDHQQDSDLGDRTLRQHANGELAAVIRDMFGPFARCLTADPHLQELILDAYASSYVKRSQARMIQDEYRLFSGAVPAIQQIQATTALPDVPMVVLSATIGMPADQREMWTGRQAALAAEIPGGRHIVLADTDHAINQVRPGQIADAINSVIDDFRCRAPGAT